MKAIVVNGKGGVETLAEVSLEEPKLKDFDLLVELKGAAVNPVDGKDREYALAGERQRVNGYDGSGIVKKIGKSVTTFKEGDEVMFAGDITRDGSFAELIAIDSRICGKKPKKLDWAGAAAFPLVSLTVWELLFENLKLPTDKSGKDLVFLMVNGAGGVGSIGIQLAKHVLGAKTIIATASRPETERWCRDMGATHIINHHNDFEEEMKNIGIDKVDVCFCAVDLDQSFDNIVKIMRPGGSIGAITVRDASKIDVSKLFFPLRLTLSFEVMFTRTMMHLKPEKQGKILNEIANLIDSGTLKSIENERLQGLSLDTVTKAEQMQDSGKSIGKTVILY